RDALHRVDRPARINVLRAHHGALADKRALADAGLRVQPRETWLRALVRRVADVRQGQGRRGGPDELGARAEHRACGITEHAVDAQALLPIGLDVFRVLHELLRQIGRLLADDVRRHGRELLQEIVEVHHEVLEDREVRERIDRRGAAVDGAVVGAAGWARLAVRVRPARPAYLHRA